MFCTNPNNIMGDKLSSQSWVFDMFSIYLGVSLLVSEVFVKMPARIPLDVFFRVVRFS